MSDKIDSPPVKFTTRCNICNGVGKVRIMEPMEEPSAVINLNNSSYKKMSEETTCPNCDGKRVVITQELAEAMKLAGIPTRPSKGLIRVVGTYEDMSIIELYH